MAGERVNLKRLRALLSAASPGPWTNNLETLCGRVWVEGPRHAQHFIAAPLFEMRGGEPGRDKADKQRQADAAFIAAMRNALPALLDEVDRLRAAPPPAPPKEAEGAAPCPACLGGGRVGSVWGDDKRRCPDCGGTGRAGRGTDGK